jgi:flagellar basal body rod protein FlgG
MAVIDALNAAAGGMAMDVSRMSTIAQNLSNTATPGYKRAVPSGVPFLLEGSSVEAVAASTADLRHASLRPTGEALDLAIDGDGFFEVQTEAGTAYTRRGDFRLDAAGRLVTHAGHVVQGQGGPLVLGTTTPTIDRSGRLFDGDKPLGQLKLVTFADPRALARGEEGLFTSEQAATVQPEGEARLRQGHLEASNVNTAAEMVRLMETVRHFEASQKVVQGVDEMTERALRKLGEF